MYGKTSRNFVDCEYIGGGYVRARGLLRNIRITEDTSGEENAPRNVEMENIRI